MGAGTREGMLLRRRGSACAGRRSSRVIPDREEGRGGFKIACPGCSGVTGEGRGSRAADLDALKTFPLLDGRRSENAADREGRGKGAHLGPKFSWHLVQQLR